jgi:glucose-6-phosphate isomerase
VRDWLGQSVGAGAGTHLVAVTASTPLALDFGVAQERVFPFWDWVGGRYSLWSAVGLPVALLIGMDNFDQLLSGARAMDEHFRDAPFEHSMPVILALLGIWNNNFFGAASHAILPYDEALALLPAWMQQLDMESSGKRVTRDGEAVDDTGAVIWGTRHRCPALIFFNCCIRHAPDTCRFYRDVPAAALRAAPRNTDGKIFCADHGTPNGAPEANAAHDIFPGSRLTTILINRHRTRWECCFALYEHKVFVQNAVWVLMH